MGKAPDAFRTISEVAAWLETPPHVLRFWETKFPQVRPVKRAGGRRYYRPDDMTLLGGIKVLLHDQGLTIRGAQKLLREKGSRYVASLSSQPLQDHWGVGTDEVIELAVEPGGQTWRSGYAAPAGDEEGATRDLWADAGDDGAEDGDGADDLDEADDDGTDEHGVGETLVDHPTSRPYRADANLASILSSVLTAPEPPAQVIPLRPARAAGAAAEPAAPREVAATDTADMVDVTAGSGLRRDVVRACDPDRLRARADDLRPLLDRLRAVHARLAG